jgi:tetratricopeptide (TPR) repeat protein
VFIGYFNLHLAQALSSQVAADTQKPVSGTYFELTDPATGEVKGYLHDQTVYDAAETKIALGYLDRGLVWGPDRLDMVFGKTHVLMEIHSFDAAADTLLAALDRTKANGGGWLWADDRPLSNGKKEFLEDIQDYYNVWFRENSPASLGVAERVARRQVELFPDHSWGFANLATVLERTGRNAEAFDPLVKAVEVDPSDLLNVNNLGHWYQLAGDLANARKEFSLLAASPDPNWSDYGKKVLDSLGR